MFYLTIPDLGNILIHKSMFTNDFICFIITIIQCVPFFYRNVKYIFGRKSINFFLNEP